jgi:hypothetical protein
MTLSSCLRALLVSTGLLSFLPTSSCEGKRARERQTTQRANLAASAQAEPLPPARAPLAGERVEIPSGTLQVGSAPGTPGRHPNLEPIIHKVELGSFEIDRLPYPNDPKRPPLLGLSRDEAKSRCAESGARLCTELEWERACKGPDSKPYPTGTVFENRCLTQPSLCASGFDVLALGAQNREWTASESGSSTEPLGILRGGAAHTATEDHRCAARTVLRPSSHNDEVGFRCCKGAPNAAIVTEPILGKAYEKLPLSAQRLEALVEKDLNTKSLASNIQLFREPEAADSVVEKGSGDRKGLTFSVSAVVWNPSVGVRFLVVPGKSGKDTSFVLAYYMSGKDDFALAASFIMKNEPGPVALAFDDSIRPRMFFSTCWGCPGETGKILFREPESVAIVQP